MDRLSARGMINHSRGKGRAISWKEKSAKAPSSLEIGCGFLPLKT
jgi:hypothetical protein